MYFHAYWFYDSFIMEQIQSILESFLDWIRHFLFIEITQLSQARSSDIDDLWLNTLGSMIGYVCIRHEKTTFPKVIVAF